MTYPTASAVIRAAVSQVGTLEYPSGSNLTPYGKAYGWNGVAWCGIFVWWAFKQAGVDLRQNGVGHPSFTPYFWEEAKKAGWLAEPDASIQPGDVLFFDFELPFNTAGIQHTGIATARPDGGYVATVEGNTSSGNRGSQDNGGGVFRRLRSLDWVVAAVRPPYAKPAHEVIRGPVKEGATDHSSDHSVAIIQRHVGQGTLVDGIFGPQTDIAVRRYQGRHGLDRDGIVGPLTARAMGVSYVAE